MSRLRVVAISAGRSVPSARFRIGQYVCPLAQYGIQLQWCAAPVSKYPPGSKWQRPLWFPLAIAGRLSAVAKSWRGDITLIAREMVSTYYTLESATRRPRVLDVDDAVWLCRGGGFARRLALAADHIIAGNEHIAAWFAQHNSNVTLLPTAVDTDRYVPAPAGSMEGQEIILLWMGTSSNFPALQAISGVLGEVLAARPAAKLRVVAERPLRLDKVPAKQFEFVRWSMEKEVGFLQSASIGLMPLVNDEWARGKCSYKMLLYLAAGAPAVCSPIGMNKQVLAKARVGFGASSAGEWRDALLRMIDDAQLRADFGRAGRDLVSREYSVRVLAPRLAGILWSVSHGLQSTGQKYGETRRSNRS